MENEKNLKVVYKYSSKIIAIIVGLILLAGLEISNIIFYIKNSQHIKYHSDFLYETNISALIWSVILLIVFFVLLIIAFKHIKVSYYEIICPYCGKVVYIKTDGVAADCGICGQRIVMENGQPEKVNKEI